MKRFISLMLALVLTLGLCACQKEDAPAPVQQAVSEFKVGYGRVDITPTELGLPMAGYGQTEKRLHTKVLDSLYASAVAITGTNGETIILMCVDLINSTQHNAIRKQIQQDLGIPYENVMWASTHTHSAPDQSSSQCGGFVTSLCSKAVQAAKLALEDQAAATISIARTETENLNFVRHYEMNDGTFGGDNFGDYSSGIKGHAEENDPGMQIIKFTRPAEDKKDIIMVNWQGHPCMTGGVDKLDMSADYIGSTRQQFEFQTKAYFIYFLGASGNQNVKSYITGETRTYDYQEQGKFLTEYIMTALENTTEVPVGEVHSTKQTYMATVNREMEDRLDDAIKIRDLYNETDRDTGNALAKKLGFSSVYHANGVISRSGISEDYLPINLTAFAFSDISFVAAPYEMFAAHGTQIKEGTPYAMTFVATCGNGATCYLPTEKAFAYGCYESHTGTYVADTGTKCAETFIAMMESMKGQ